MKIRQEISPLRRRLISLVSAGLVLGLWIVLTLPVLPPLPADEQPAPSAQPAAGERPAPEPGPSRPGADPTSEPAREQELSSSDFALGANQMRMDSGEQTSAARPVGPVGPTGVDGGSSEAAGIATESQTDDGDHMAHQGNLEYWQRVHGVAVGGRQPIIPTVVLPSPWRVLSALAYLHTEQGLVRSAVVSFLRITFSFLLAVMVAIPLAVLMGSYPPIAAWFEPFTGPLRYLPISAVTGLFILLFGIEEEMKIAFLFVGSVVYLIPICAEAIQSVEDIYLETAYTLGAKPAQVILRVLLPAAWPSIFEACRVIYGVGWTYVILAELINAKYGLGYLISIAYKRGNIDQAYALVLIILLLGVGTNELFRLAGRRIFAWREA